MQVQSSYDRIRVLCPLARSHSRQSEGTIHATASTEAAAEARSQKPATSQLTASQTTPRTAHQPTVGSPQKRLVEIVAELELPFNDGCLESVVEHVSQWLDGIDPKEL